MILNRAKQNTIFNELNNDDSVYFFDLKKNKFLHNIDTFYYTVKLNNDFTENSTDSACLFLRKYFNDYIEKGSFNDIKEFYIPKCSENFVLRNFKFAGFYNINISCPDMFDIFIADKVPCSAGGNDSVTSEIVVQIRSYMLWSYGASLSFQKSFECVKAFCEMFHLSIYEVKENRVDYCWHTNYLQNPEIFFRIDNFSKMQVSRFKRIRYDYEFKLNNEYESDYIALGKRSDKCFVRIYLKSKEVVEQGYKGWFFYEWLFNGLISRYDLFIYEKCFKRRNWNYVDKARLEFYLEYGQNEYNKTLIRSVLFNKSHSDKFIHSLANTLTPPVTLIVNVEFQTTRRMSKSFKLLPIKDNSSKGCAKRIYDYLDNHNLITDYLTHSTLRLVNPGSDSNKSRNDYCNFWKCLRNTKYIDVSKSPKNLKLVRDYSRNLNKDLIKNRMISSVSSYSLYKNGINEFNVTEDLADLFCLLNDNDIYYASKVKEKKIRQLNKNLYTEPIKSFEDKYNINYIVAAENGEFFI